MKATKAIKDLHNAAEESRERFEKNNLKQETDATGRSYDSNQEIKWGKLDNTAHLFPVIAGEGMSNVYRIAVYLKEEIRGDLLQQALDLVLPKVPVFNSRLRQGMFWYYFEENGKLPPRVHEEDDYPCQYIKENTNRNYMFRLTYYKNRINLEVFHVLTDGSGGFAFLKEIAYQYLRLSHKELGDVLSDELSRDFSLNVEDSYLANFKKTKFSKGYKKEHAYILKGIQLGTGKMGVIHGRMPVESLKEKAKEYGASINEYLVSVFIYSIYLEYLKGMPSRRPITISVPVNLRPFFGSVTSKNFFVMVTAIFRPERENQSFEDVMDSVKSSLREQITKEHLEDILSYNVTGEHVLILRTIPLIFKKPGIRGFYKMAAKSNTATITNVGQITVLPEYEAYIDKFDVLLSRSAGQNIKLALVSYKGEMTVTITSSYRDERIQRVFFRYLASQDLPITIETNGIYYER